MKVKQYLLSIVLAIFTAGNGGWATEISDNPLSASDYLLSASKQKMLDTLLASGFRESGTVGQSVMLLQDGKLVYSHHAGTTRLNGKERVDADTIFPVYSVTKLFVAVLSAQLVSQGRLDLSGSVTDYLDFVPKHWQSIKVAHLLAHSSGLPEFYGTGLEKHSSVADIMVFLKQQPMAFPVNSQVRYNQTNFLLLKLILEKLHNKGFQQIFAEEFTKPLNLMRTTYTEPVRSFMTRTSHYPNSPENRVYHYYKRNNDELKELASPEFAEVMYASSGLNISAADLAAWFEALLSGRYVGLEDLIAGWQPGYLNSGTMGEYSNGWQVLKDEKVTAVGHYGDMFVNVRHFFLNAAQNSSVTVIHLNNGGFHVGFSPFDFSYDLARVINPDIELGTVEFKRELLAHAARGNFQQLHQTYKRFLQQPARQSLSTEGLINELGYQLLGQIPQAAVLLFQLNLERYPDSANAYDSYAEALFQIGNYKEAKRNYEKALSMAPDYQHISPILLKLEGLLAE